MPQSHSYMIDNSQCLITLPDGRLVFINISDRSIDVGRQKQGEEYPTFQMTDWKEYNNA